jgi:ABC-type multidrug transport system fused ATPase/permease subunit
VCGGCGSNRIRKGLCDQLSCQLYDKFLNKQSTLTLALLRCIVTDGTVYYDGIPTNSVNLDALRSSITIIPQVPELLNGTLRQNLDPFNQFDDARLNDALQAAGWFPLQNDDDESQLSLDSMVSGGGGNLSFGQRQILALSRAIVRQSKLLILDEGLSTCLQCS